MTDFIKVSAVSLSGIVLSDFLEPVSVFLKLIALVLTVMYGALKYTNELIKYNKNKKEDGKGD